MRAFQSFLVSLLLSIRPWLAVAQGNARCTNGITEVDIQPVIYLTELPYVLSGYLSANTVIPLGGGLSYTVLNAPVALDTRITVTKTSITTTTSTLKNKPATSLPTQSTGAIRGPNSPQPTSESPAGAINGPNGPQGSSNSAAGGSRSLNSLQRSSTRTTGAIRGPNSIQTSSAGLSTGVPPRYIFMTVAAGPGASAGRVTIPPTGTAPGTIIIITTAQAANGPQQTQTPEPTFNGPYTTITEQGAVDSEPITLTVSPSASAQTLGTVFVVTPAPTPNGLFVTSTISATQPATITVQPSGTLAGTVFVIQSAAGGQVNGPQQFTGPYTTITEQRAAGIAPTTLTVPPTSSETIGTVFVFAPIRLGPLITTTIAGDQSTTITVPPSDSLPGTVLIITSGAFNAPQQSFTGVYTTITEIGASGADPTTLTLQAEATATEATVLVFRPAATIDNGPFITSTVGGVEPTTLTIPPRNSLPGTILVVTSASAAINGPQQTQQAFTGPYITITEQVAFGREPTAFTVNPTSGETQGTVILVTPGPNTVNTAPLATTTIEGAQATTITVLPSGQEAGTVIIITTAEAVPAFTGPYQTITQEGIAGSLPTSFTIQPAASETQGTVVIFTPAASATNSPQPFTGPYITITQNGAAGSLPTSFTIRPQADETQGTIVLITPVSVINGPQQTFSGPYITITGQGPAGSQPTTLTARPVGSEIEGTIIVVTPAPNAFNGPYATVTAVGAPDSEPSTLTLNPTGSATEGTVIIITPPPVVAPFSGPFVTITGVGDAGSPEVTITLAPSSDASVGTVIVQTPRAPEFSFSGPYITRTLTGAAGSEPTSFTLAVSSGATEGIVILETPAPVVPVFNGPYITITGAGDPGSEPVTLTILPSSGTVGTVIVQTPLTLAPPFSGPWTTLTVVGPAGSEPTLLTLAVEASATIGTVIFETPPPLAFQGPFVTLTGVGQPGSPPITLTVPPQSAGDSSGTVIIQSPAAFPYSGPLTTLTVFGPADSEETLITLEAAATATLGTVLYETPAPRPFNGPYITISGAGDSDSLPVTLTLDPASGGSVGTVIVQTPAAVAPSFTGTYVTITLVGQFDSEPTQWTLSPDPDATVGTVILQTPATRVFDGPYNTITQGYDGAVTQTITLGPAGDATDGTVIIQTPIPTGPQAPCLYSSTPGPGYCQITLPDSCLALATVDTASLPSSIAACTLDLGESAVGNVATCLIEGVVMGGTGSNTIDCLNSVLSGKCLRTLTNACLQLTTTFTTGADFDRDVGFCSDSLGPFRGSGSVTSCLDTAIRSNGISVINCLQAAFGFPIQIPTLPAGCATQIAGAPAAAVCPQMPASCALLTSSTAGTLTADVALCRSDLGSLATSNAVGCLTSDLDRGGASIVYCLNSALKGQCITSLPGACQALAFQVGVSNIAKLVTLCQTAITLFNYNGGTACFEQTVSVGGPIVDCLNQKLFGR